MDDVSADRGSAIAENAVGLINASVDEAAATD